MTKKANTYPNDEFANMLANLLLISFGFAAAICMFYYYHFYGAISQEHTKWAEFGDFVGGTVGTVISFFAFFALLLTIRIQNKALKSSQEELSLTRKELKKTSKAASEQAKHFTTEAKIQDLVESIKLIEGTISSKAKYTIAVGDIRETKPSTIPLSYFLKKEMAVVSFLYGVDKDVVKDLDLRQEEIGSLFKLLFDQLMQLRQIKQAENRYKVLMHKHLEIFFLLSQVSALTFDWKKELDEESRSWIKTYEHNFKAHQIEHQRQIKELRSANKVSTQ